MLSTIIEKKREEFEKEFVKKNTNWCESGWTVPFVDSRADGLESFIEKAIRESVEEALREVLVFRKIGTTTYMEGYEDALNDIFIRVKEFMK